MTPQQKSLELTEGSCRHLKNLRLDTDIGPLDCLGRIDGVGNVAEVQKSCIMIQVDDIQLRVLGLDGLIKAKQALNRPRDKEMVLQLEAIKKQTGTKTNDIES